MYILGIYGVQYTKNILSMVYSKSVLYDKNRQEFDKFKHFHTMQRFNMPKPQHNLYKKKIKKKTRMNRSSKLV